MEDQVAGIKGEKCQLLTFWFVQLKNGLKRVFSQMLLKSSWFCSPAGSKTGSWSPVIWSLHARRSPCCEKPLSWVCHIRTCHVALCAWQVMLWAPGAPVASPSNLLPEAGSICPCLCLLIDEAQQTCSAAHCCHGWACCQHPLHVSALTTSSTCCVLCPLNNLPGEGIFVEWILS